jgi:hypothetical protein
MKRLGILAGFGASLGVLLLTSGLSILLLGRGGSDASEEQDSDRATVARRIPYSQFEVDVLVNGRPLQEYSAGGRTYIEALKGQEYELRIRNPLPQRVAVALSVDGLNSIDARHTSAWNASKWVIEPYQTITISGWQMSSDRARHFYFTNEGDSYGAKLGQTANLGVISAVFFTEHRPRPVPITPPRPMNRDSEQSESRKESPSTSAGAADSSNRSKSGVVRRTDDDYAATGIGRSVRNDVQWVDMNLNPKAAGEVNIRYEYYSALLRLGVVPRRSDPYPLPRRENSRGFSPEP